MEKTATLNLRVNPDVKEKAEEVLSKLGVPMSTAITIYLNQIALPGGIPFSVNADMMTNAQLHDKLAKGYADIETGRVYKAAETFAGKN